jgi:hypothetical protein
MARQLRTVARSFSGGELGPEMHGRIDDLKFQNGAAQLRNMISKPQGPAFRRPGTRLVRQAGESANRVRLLPFRFSGDQTMVLELGRRDTLDGVTLGRSLGYIRFHTQGKTLLYDTPRAYVAPLNFTPAMVSATQGTSIATFSSSLQVAGTPFGVNSLVGETVWHVNGTGMSTGVVLSNTSNTITLTAPWTGGTPATGTFVHGNGIIDFGVPHLLLTGDPIVFTKSGGSLPAWGSIAGPTELLQLTQYFVVKIDSTRIKIAASYAAALVANVLTWAGAGAGTSGQLKLHFAYQPGDLVHWDQLLNANYYCMVVPWLDHLDHAPLVTPWSDYWARLPADGVYEIPHFWADQDLFDVNFGGQTGDVLRLFHPSYRPLALSRVSATKWTLAEITMNTNLAAPSGLAANVTGGAAIAVVSGNNGTARLQLASNHEFLQGDPVRVTGLSLAPPDGCSIPDGRYVVNEPPPGAGTVSYLGLRQVNGGAAVVVQTAASLPTGGHATPMVRPVSLSGDDVSAYVVTSVDSKGAESLPTAPVFAVNNLRAVAGSYNTLSWNAVTGAIRYRVYKADTAYETSPGSGIFAARGLYGFVGEVDAAAATSFVDDDIAPDLGRSPPLFDQSMALVQTVTFDTGNNLVLCTNHGLLEGTPVIFTTSGVLPAPLVQGDRFYVLNPTANAYQLASSPGGTSLSITTGLMTGTHAARTGAWPGAGCTFDQRQVFAGPRMQRKLVRMTHSGTETDLSYHLPVMDSDRISFDVAAQEGMIRHAVDLGHLLLLGDTAEFRVSPLNSDAITPSSISVRAQSYTGSSTVPPALVNGSVLFAAARGGHVYEGSFQGLQPQTARFLPTDISLRAAHLFDHETIVQQAFQRAPLPIDWLVSSSGKLLGFTYVPEEAVGAWHWMDTPGTFESVCVVSEGSEDRVYVVVRRTIAGQDLRFVEQLGALRQPAKVADSYFVDCGLTFDGRNTSPVRVSISGGASWNAGELVTVNSDSPGIFRTGSPSPDLGAWLVVTGPDGQPVTLEITAVTTIQQCTARVRSRNVPVSLRPPTPLIPVAVTSWAFARATFSVGHLEGESPQILADGLVQPGQKVVGGVLTLGTPAQVVHIGLKASPTLRTLPVVLQVDGYGQGRRKNVSQAWVKVVASGRFLIGVVGGKANPARDTDGNELLPGVLNTAQVSAGVPGDWSDDGQIELTMDDPLPLTVTQLVLGVVPGD